MRENNSFYLGSESLAKDSKGTNVNYLVRGVRIIYKEVSERRDF